jgi:tetratricopeptide (TPR) repeat protein
MTDLARTLILLLCLTVTACEQAEVGDASATAVPDTVVPLYTNLGTHHYRITTAVPEAQEYFDQGLRLTYAFNHAEAIRAFEEAWRRDPTCAMCQWGIALALGPNINAPMDADAERAAHAAIERAHALASGASPVERALIEALRARYIADPGPDRTGRDSAYALAMERVVQSFPDDTEAATLYAESLMDLRPWSYWTRDGTPEPGTDRILASLERVIGANPDHPGACHFYIHAVEAAHPERAVPCAERLAGLMPGAGHLVHMPAHIYIRVGRWNDAIAHNEHAVHVDEQYIADQRPTGVYPIAYYPHNYHFLSFAATMAGRSRQAITAAEAVVERVDADVAREVPDLQGLIAHHHLTLLSFGRWDELLAAPRPAASLPFAHAMAEYSRGVAHAARGAPGEARRSLTVVEAAREAITAEPAHTVLAIAAQSLSGEIEARAGNHDAAITHLRAAMELEDGLIYMEPPYWHRPVRHTLGAVLLDAGRASEAEQLYREDLARFPENGWSLLGLARSLREQGSPEAEEVEERFARAWSEADIRPTASRF